MSVGGAIGPTSYDFMLDGDGNICITSPMLLHFEDVLVMEFSCVSSTLRGARRCGLSPAFP
jgi:hypothetical protein